MLFASCLCSAFLLRSPHCSFNCLPPKHVLCSISKIAALFCFMEEVELQVAVTFASRLLCKPRLIPAVLSSAPSSEASDRNL